MKKEKLSELLHEATTTKNIGRLLEIELEILDEALVISGENEYQFNDSMVELIDHFSDFRRRVQNSPYRGKIISKYLDIFAEYCCEQ